MNSTTDPRHNEVPYVPHNQITCYTGLSIMRPVQGKNEIIAFTHTPSISHHIEVKSNSCTTHQGVSKIQLFSFRSKFEGDSCRRQHRKQNCSELQYSPADDTRESSKVIRHKLSTTKAIDCGGSNSWRRFRSHNYMGRGHVSIGSIWTHTTTLNGKLFSR